MDGDRVAGFRLATINDRGRRVAALETDDAYWPLDAFAAAGVHFASLDVRQLLDDWPTTMDRLHAAARLCASGAIARSVAVPKKGTVPELPIRFPNKLIAVGANYASHLQEMGLPPDRWTPMPFFLMPPTTAMVGPGRTVVKPSSTEQFDWEVELAIVVGRRMKKVDVKDAMAGIAGYSIGLDLSARDLVRPPNIPMPDFMRGKCQDTMCPFGPSIVPAEFIPDPHRLRLTLSVNGELKQDGSTSEMIYSIPEMISIISGVMTLEPGDVLLTGTPAGSGKHYNQYLNAGDTITAEIEGIGTLALEVTSGEG
jgi:2-keto-4-pentenoate hydratase/2-oxohepta-3-ene-1,7-dioic acid hydratase in catechol pathway